MKTNRLLRVGLPLTAAAVISLALNFRWPSDGFFLNLATEFIGILVTVSYVDWIISSHENAKWKPFDARIADRLRATLNATVRSIGTPLGFTAENLGLGGMAQNSDVLSIHKMLIRHSVYALSPTLEIGLLKLDNSGWKKIYSNIHRANETIRDFRSTFRERLTPDQKSDLLDLEEHLATSMQAYVIFPDIMGVPVDEAPKGKTPTLELQQIWCNLSAKSLKLAIDSAKLLSDSLPDDATAKNR